MRILALTLYLLLTEIGFGQTYQPTWESIDQRPTPQWFRDAKFGIFIHWGVYAVPGWSTKGNYSEWYQQGLQTTDSARMRYHKAKFGERSYYDLAKDFKAELYKPDEWAKLFERAGAKYIVLTSKHHDGYALWPSKEASSLWGFPWNAMEVGPKRDLLGDLFAAVRKTSVRAGMYYSLYEWFNPLWKKDPKEFAAKHTWPQMKDLINTYRPDVFWTDGDWDAPAETWKSQEFIAWLYNESPVKNSIVVNDRWGSGVRFKHGGIYTPEYQPDLDFEDHYWEESRGMGYSYGYNREEDAWDYNSTRSLVIALVDKVSRGGNFLLDIGPDEHGKIPPIMQQRLLEMGEWLHVHGEAIYGTSRWKTPSQWSEGRRDYKFRNEHATEDWKTGGDLMLKLTVDPDPGYAVKELFFSYNEKTNALYGIFPRYPSNNKLVLKDMLLPAGTVITLLSDPQTLTWKQVGENIEVALPAYDPNRMKQDLAYAIKIAGFGKFTSKPVIQVSYKPGALRPDVSMSAQAGASIYYTMDGSEPTQQSLRYERPLSPEGTATLKAKAFIDGVIPSAVAQESIKVYSWKAGASRPKGVLPGLSYKAYELNPASTKDMDQAQPVKNGVAEQVGTGYATRQENVALRFEGFLKIDVDAIYDLYLSSDDGSRLWIDGEEIIDHDGFHGNDEKRATVALRKGFHTIRVDYMQATGGIDLSLKISSSQIKKQSIPSSYFFHK